jgi:transposase
MATSTVPLPTRSLEDLRHEQMMSIAEWSRHLGMTEQTYRRLLADPQSVRPATKRQAREILAVTPYDIWEFYPVASVTRAAAAVAAYRRGNAEGWIATDPHTGEPTGEVFDGQGNLMEG